MITVSEIGPRAVAIVTEGDITPEDVTTALAQIDAVRARWPKFDVLADVRGQVTFGFAALAAEAKRLTSVFALLGALDRVALVADAEWIKLVGKIEGKLLFMLDYRTFDRDQFDVARAWVLRQE